MIATRCLSDEQLDRFASGNCPAGQFDQMLAHLDDCQSCQNKSLLRQNGSDRFVSLLKAPIDDPVLAEPDCGAAILNASANSPAMRLDRVLPPIESLGPYRLIRPLGHGGMGAVYLAEHTRLKKQCAIKLLPRERGFDAAWLERFQREMQAVASLDHAGIVAATDAGDVDGWHYLVMEYLDGLDLSAIVHRLGPLSVGVAANIGGKIAEALAVIHDAGLIHRDVKPSNVMLTRDGQIKLLDLGLVLDGQAAAELRLTTVGHVIGTLVYAAPEQLASVSTLDGRTDLYGLGATLFQLVAGRTAHRSDQGIAPLVIDKTSREAKRLGEVRPGVPAELDEIVSQLMRRDPDQRPTSASEVAQRLAPLSGDESLKSLVRQALRIDATDIQPVSLAWPTVAVPPPSPPRTNWLAWGLGGFAALLLGVVIITIQNGDREIVITSDEDDVSVAINETPAVDTIPNEDRVYQGKPMSHWKRLLMIERDTNTLGDAMNAIVRLADPNDVDAANSILVTTRRLGGWVAGSDDPSGEFMNQFVEVFPKLMPEPGIQAITSELAVGDPQSTAACFMSLNYYPKSKLKHWLRTHPDQSGKLHDVMKERMRTDPLWASDSIIESEPDFRDVQLTRDTMRSFSLDLAVLLNRSFDDEPGLKQSLQREIAAWKPLPPIEERLHSPSIPGTDDFTRLSFLSPAQTVAADHFSLEMPTPLAVHSWLNFDKTLRQERNAIFLREIKDDSAAIADETLYWLNQLVSYDPNEAETLGYPGGFGSNTYMPGPSYRLSRNESLWIEALPLIVRHTTEPKLAQAILTSVDVNANRLQLYQMNVAEPAFSEAMKKIIQESIESLSERIEPAPE